MISRRDLLSSTAVLPAPPDPGYVHARDLMPGSTYSIVARETPQTITFDDILGLFEREQKISRRYLTPAEQQEIWENRFRPIPTSAGDIKTISFREFLTAGSWDIAWDIAEAEDREILLAKIEDDKRSLRKLIDEAPDDFTRAWHEGEWRLLYGDGSGRPGGIFDPGLTKRRK